MGGALAAAIAGKTGHATEGNPIRIGVLNDQSGSYAALTGPGSVTAARMAIEDAGGSVLGRPVELLVADHQNKADIGATIAREWADQASVGLIIDIGHSAVALAVQEIVREKNRIAIYTSVGTTRITEESCTPNGFSWCYDAYALATGLTAALSQRGLKTWFFVVTDYSFGRSLEEEMRAAVARTGGSVVGAVRHPEHASDFSSYMLQAIEAKPQALGLLNSGEDMVNALKQALEFGFPGQIAAPLVFITDVHAIGLSSAQGLTFVTAFYWDRTEETRRFGQRFFAVQNAMPSMAQAAVYSGVSHYLKSVAAAGTTANDAVLTKMRALPVNDFYAQNAWLRADGRLMHDLYLVQVKSPSGSKRPWDYYDVLATISAEQAFRKPSESRCPLLRT
jgi:branched-chain amino acid transport system substrate-binding protein